MRWSEESRNAFLKFVGKDRRHVFFTPDASALVRSGWGCTWIKVHDETMERFWLSFAKTL